MKLWGILWRLCVSRAPKMLANPYEDSIGESNRAYEDSDGEQTGF